MKSSPQAAPERPLCSCDTCLAITGRLLRDAAPVRQVRADTPTPEEFRKHAQRFGIEFVSETAEELGVSVEVERPKTVRKRAKGPTLRQRVADHVAAGRGVELIAELEDVSPSRARQLVQEVQSGTV